MNALNTSQWEQNFGMRIDPDSSSYTISVTKFLEEAHKIITKITGIKAELCIENGRDNALILVLKKPYIAVNGPDKRPWPIFELFRDHHKLPIECGNEFANEIIGCLFNTSRFHINNTKLCDIGESMTFTITAKPRRRYFIVINPSSDYYLYAFHQEYGINSNDSMLLLRDEQPEPIKLWEQDALEIPKYDYDYLVAEETKNNNSHNKCAFSIVEKHLKNRLYRYYMDINEKHERYRSIYMVSPLQKYPDITLNAFDEIEGTPVKLEGSEEEYLNLTYEDYSELWQVASQNGFMSELYITKASRIIHKQKPVYQDIGREQLQNLLLLYPLWDRFIVNTDKGMALEAFIDYLNNCGCDQNIDTVMFRLSANQSELDFALKYVKDHVLIQLPHTKEKNYLMTKEQTTCMGYLKSVISDLHEQCVNDLEFNDWLSEKRIFAGSLNELLNELTEI